MSTPPHHVTTNQQSQYSNHQQNNSPELYQRRESLVKPTWHNVCPGQVPTSTLEKLNKFGNGVSVASTSSSSSGKSYTQNTNNNNNNGPHQHHHHHQNETSTTLTSLGQRKQVELFDIFGKVMLLGDSGVGKTCLLVRFRDGTFLSGNFISTVGIDFRNKLVMLDNTRVKLQIWDTAGQERFRSVTHAYYRDAHALLLLYDVTNKVSFDNIRAWLVEIREYAQDDVVIMLLGNKADCPDREVKREEGERLAREYNVAFMETSAKTGLNVELAFLAVARKLKSRKSESIDESRFNVQDYVKEQTQKTTCPPCNL